MLLAPTTFNSLAIWLKEPMFISFNSAMFISHSIIATRCALLGKPWRHGDPEARNGFVRSAFIRETPWSVFVGFVPTLASLPRWKTKQRVEADRQKFCGLAVQPQLFLSDSTCRPCSSRSNVAAVAFSAMCAIGYPFPFPDVLHPRSEQQTESTRL